jgi:hypothetical protein
MAKIISHLAYKMVIVSHPFLKLILVLRLLHITAAFALSIEIIGAPIVCVMLDEVGRNTTAELWLVV